MSTSKSWILDLYIDQGQGRGFDSRDRTLIYCILIEIVFLPTPLAVAWVFRLTFSPSPPSPSPSPPSHFQLFVSVRYRKHHGGAWVLGREANNISNGFDPRIIRNLEQKCQCSYYYYYSEILDKSSQPPQNQDAGVEPQYQN